MSERNLLVFAIIGMFFFSCPAWSQGTFGTAEYFGLDNSPTHNKNIGLDISADQDSYSIGMNRTFSNGLTVSGNAFGVTGGELTGYNAGLQYERNGHTFSANYDGFDRNQNSLGWEGTWNCLNGTCGGNANLPIHDTNSFGIGGTYNSESTTFSLEAQPFQNTFSVSFQTDINR